MTRQFGELLQKWRAQRRLSLGALAARAGVAKGTLSGWERGLHQPRLPELDAVLTAIGATFGDRREALVLIDAPRAERSLALLSSSVSAGLAPDAQPVPGHLLQALRLRRGLTMEAVAQEVGATRSTVSRWEQSASRPSPARLQKLLHLLGARAEEQNALLSGRRLLLPLAAGSPPPLSALEQRLRELGLFAQGSDRALLDLEFLAWQAQVWPLAARTAGARELLARGWALYASWLTWEGRLRAAGSYAKRAFDLARAEGRTTPGLLETMEMAVHVTGLATAHGPARGAKAAAVEWLQVWLPAASGSRWEIALYRDMAENAWWAEQPDAAEAFSQRACRLAERLGEEPVTRLCRAVRADLFVRSGQPQKALELLSPPEAHADPFAQILETLRWVRVLIDLGERAAAADRLASAYALIERYGYHGFRTSADALAREF